MLVVTTSGAIDTGPIDEMVTHGSPSELSMQQDRPHTRERRQRAPAGPEIIDSDSRRASGATLIAEGGEAEQPKPAQRKAVLSHVLSCRASNQEEGLSTTSEKKNTALGSDGQGPKGFSFVFLDLF